MNADLKEAFSHIKPVCDIVMVLPTPEHIATFMKRVAELKKEAVQELQQYILFPFITHLTAKEIRGRYEAAIKLVEAIKMVLERVTVTSLEMCVRLETGLLSLVFDKANTGMVANTPEELKLPVIEALTSLMLSVDSAVRCQLLQSHVPLMAQAVFVSVNIAKIERLRSLRVSSISCVLAHTCSHPALDKGLSPKVESLAVDMVSSILPGVLAALQDVATCTDNPGHAVVVAALNATHRIVCLTMNDKYLIEKETVTVEDFAQMIIDKTDSNKEVSEVKPGEVPRRSPEWFKMAGDKLVVVIKSLVSCCTHEHYKVRRELAVLCHRLLTECHRTMQPSASLALDVLISLSNDTHPEVSKYCNDAVNGYFRCTTQDALDSLCDSLFDTLNELPRVLNNIDSSRKLSCLSLLHGYLRLLRSGRPQRLTTALSSLPRMRALCDAILPAAACHYSGIMAQHATRDVTSPPPLNSPWCKLRNLDTPECETRLKEICQLLGEAECSELILDWLLEHLRQTRDCESVWFVNWMGAGPNSSESVSKRILETYLEDDIWYSALEMSVESPVTCDDTLDVTVYNPRAWTKDAVPDLYEGAVETRYTYISYSTPRLAPSTGDPNYCNSLAEAQKNLVLSCLVTEGVGLMAARLKDGFQPYLLKTLCLVLERVGSKYELLHLAGLKAINDIAKACNHSSVADLIKCNSDYFTSQITVRLKKSWDSQSALRILAVVMEYSDANVLDCLYGIVEDVLVQSCDKYHENNLQAYLQVFLTFIECIKKWFPNEHTNKNQQETHTNHKIDVLKDVIEYAKNKEESETLLTHLEFEQDSGKSAEDMYREDQREKEDNVLEYDDRVTDEKQPLPQHIKVTLTILKRCINFIQSKHRDDSILALQVLTKGLPVLGPYEDELLPLVHQTWSPLVGRFDKVVVLKRAMELLVVLAELSKDFIRSRAIKDVLPHIFAFLQKSSIDSYLKDIGSAYRTSQAFSLQVAGLTSLPSLVIDLGLEDEKLEQAMACVDSYLSKKQPKVLQTLAVSFFRQILEHDYSATWHHLRKLCSNDQVLMPPDSPLIKLEPLVGTPYFASNKDYDCNIRLVFQWNE